MMNGTRSKVPINVTLVPLESLLKPRSLYNHRFVRLSFLLSLCERKITSIQPKNFIFGGIYSSDPRKKWLDFRENRHRVQVSVGHLKYWSTYKR